MKRYVATTASVTALLGAALACGFAAADAPARPAAEHAHAVMAPGAGVPGESLYQLDTKLETQDGRTLELAALRGAPVLVTMFYASCEGVCPLIAVHLRRIESRLDPTQRERLRVLMVSFDPARDTPEALAKFARDHRADTSRWVLARADDGDTREIAAALGIRYRGLPNGVFSHSTVITVLDSDGVMRARTSDLKEIEPGFLAVLAEALP
jgi:protein SCO1